MKKMMTNKKFNKDKIDENMLYTYTPCALWNIDRILFLFLHTLNLLGKILSF